MRRIAWFFLSIMFVCSAALADSGKGPRISIPDSNATYGKEVMEGEVVNHEFIVMNEGNETLQIKAVRPG